MRKRDKRVRFEVLPDADGGWAVTRERVVTGVWPTKGPAVAWAASEGRKAWAKGQPAQLLIKGRDGRIQDERTYGRDPRHVPG